MPTIGPIQDRSHPIRLTLPVAACALAACALVAAARSTPVARAAAAPNPAPQRETTVLLDYAFRFASAIANDPKDKAKAQELALDEFAAAGLYDEVVLRAEAVEGWRRGVVYANLATDLARKGRAAESRRFVEKAEAVRATVEGWQNPRISAHVAEALAVLGEKDRAAAITTELRTADPMQYAGRAAATEATGLAASGDFQQALKRLAELEGNDDLDVAWWRTSGYLALARLEAAPRGDRLAALKKARASADRLPLERRVEALLEVASACVTLDRRGDGRSAVVAAEAAAGKSANSPSGEVSLRIELARGWSEVGEAKRARAALEKAGTQVPGSLNIDRPGLYARIASGYRRMQDTAAAARLDRRGLDGAAGFPLSRPRALCLAAVCRQMGRDGVVPDAALRARLDTLLAGLGEPW